MTISVVIPALNEAERIASAVESITRQSDDVEIIVVDGGSSDGTPNAVPPPACCIAGPRGRGMQMNLGARHTSGDILLFLHADSVLHEDALRELRLYLADPHVAGGTFTLRFDSETPLLRFYSRLTRLRFRLLHFGDQGIFVRRSVFERLGGFAELPLMEDLDFLKRLSRAGKRIVIDLPVTTSARRFLDRGIIHQQLLNIMLVGLFALGISPLQLARWYDRGSIFTRRMVPSSTAQSSSTIPVKVNEAQ